MEWIVIGVALALASGVLGIPYALLFKPWRMKKLAYALMGRWPWYRSYVYRLIMRRMIRATRKVTETMGRALLPAMQKAAASMQAFVKQVEEAGIVLD